MYNVTCFGVRHRCLRNFCISQELGPEGSSLVAQWLAFWAFTVVAWVQSWRTEITQTTQYAPSQKRHKILIVKNNSKTAHQFSLVHVDNETDYVVANKKTDKQTIQPNKLVQQGQGRSGTQRPRVWPKRGEECSQEGVGYSRPGKKPVNMGV